MVKPPFIQQPERLSGVSPENAEALKKYVTARRLEGVKPSTISANVAQIASWMRYIEKPAVEWTVDDIKSELVRRLDLVDAGEKSGVSVDVELQSIKMFYRFLNPDKPRIDIRKKPTKTHLKSTDYVSVKQILEMKAEAEKAGDLRTAAVIMVLYGAGLRISELLGANIEDVVIGSRFASIKVDGKTGPRTVPFVDGLPELVAWINMHPDNKNPKAPVFCSLKTRGHANTRLRKESVGSMLDKYAERAGIPEDVKHNPHALRHRAATEDDRSYTHQEMCLKYGWSFDSDMPKRYTHSDFDSLTRTMLASKGITPDEEPEEVDTVKQCNRCKHLNPSNALFCAKCGLPLDRHFEHRLQKFARFADKIEFV